MRRTTRWFGLLSFVCLTASVAPTRAADIEKLLPKDVDSITSLNIEQILASDLVKKYALDFIKDGLKKNEQAKAILENLGLDPMKDFSRIYFAGGFDPTDPKQMIIIEGKFDPKKLDAFAEEAIKNAPGQATTEKVKGKNAYKFDVPNAPISMYGMIANDQYIVIGSDKAYLEGAIDAIDGKRKSELNKDLANLLAKADSKASMFMVASTKGKLDKLPIPGGNAPDLEKIDFVAAELRVEKDVKFNIAIGIADEDTAKGMNNQLSAALQQGKALLPLFLGQNPRLKPLTDIVGGIKSTQKGKVITVSAEMSSDQIDSLIKGDK